jgi:DNA-binding transcriptional LysR family regulator
MALDWDKLRIFYAAAQAGSFTRAGENLGLSQSAVSRQISALEEDLNVSLFHRHARGLVMTEQGETLYQTVKEIFTSLAKVENALTESRERPKGPLRVTTTVDLGTLWLAPILREFVDLYPEIHCSLIVEDKLLDLGMREADIAIRLTTPRQPDLISRQLMVIEQGIYASKDYLQRFGAPATLDELDRHQLIGFAEDSRAPHAQVNWLLKAGGRDRAPRQTVFEVNSLVAMLHAANAGMGIVSLPTFVVESATTAPLTRILSHIEGPKIEAHFVYAAEMRHSKRLNVFRDFLLRKVSEARWSQAI